MNDEGKEGADLFSAAVLVVGKEIEKRLVSRVI